MPKYVFLLWQDENKRETPGTSEFDSEYAAYGAVQQEAIGAGVIRAGQPLQPASAGQVVRVRNGHAESSTGSFSNTAEQVIGVYELECQDAADAAAWAAKIPAAAKGAIEVRPVQDM